MKFLTTNIIPCWYEMAWRGWQGEEPAILLRVHKDFIRNTKPVLETASVVRGLKEKFFDTLFDTFDGDLAREYFGFNKAFKRTRDIGEFVEFAVTIPVIKKLTGKTCSECDGTKKDRVLEDRECLHCDGKGEEYQIDWRLAYSISASFTIFTAISEYPELETSCLAPQLLTFHTITASGQHGGSLGGDYSIPLVNWLSKLGRSRDTKVTAMIYAMKTTYKAMLGELDEFDERNFDAYVASENGHLSVGCPGDRSSLYPADNWLRSGEGYKFACHNIDTPVQQITLIAGLAALYEKAQRDIALYGSD